MSDFDFEPLKQRLQKSIDGHSPMIDGWAFNGGTLSILLLTALSSLYSSGLFGSGRTGVGAVLAAAAGILVAAERALAFGARWRFHHEMRNAYLSILDMIDFAQLLPEGEERTRYMKDIWTALYAVRSRESAIPGTGSAPR